MKNKKKYLFARLIFSALIFIVFVVIIFLADVFRLEAQQLKLSNWKVHTSMFDVRSSTMDSRNRVCLGTTGGVIIYDKNKRDTILLNHANGLISSNIRKLCAVLEQKLIVAGSFDGVLELINEDLIISHITSIRDHGFSNATINDIVSYNNKIYIAGGWGLAEFDFSEKIFTSTVEKIGNFQKNTSVHNILVNRDSLWVSTDYGLAVVPLSEKINISRNWQTFEYKLPDMPNESQILMSAQIIKNSDNIYINSDKNIYLFDINSTEDSKFKSIFSTDGADYNNIIKIASFQGDILYSTAYNIINLGKGEIFSNWDTRANGFDIVNSPDVNIIFNYVNLGAELIKSTHSSNSKQETENFIPNTPCSNFFISIAIDSKGKIFGVSDNSQNHGVGSGIMSLDEQTWINYNKLHYNKNIPISASEKITAISISSEDVVYACGWGKGLYIFNDAILDTSEKFLLIDETNSPMTPYSSTYRIAGETAFDKNGRPWTVNYGENISGTLLFTYDIKENNTINNFIAFENPFSKNDRYFHNISIDNYGTKWIYTGSGSSTGILYFNDKNTPEDTKDDVWGKITTSTHSALLDNIINCIAIDNYTSQIWLGTQKGITRIYNPYAVTSGGNLMLGKFSFLENQNINYIMIDAVGNKWLATNVGIFVLNQAGDDTLTSIKTSNSPLVTNEVYSLAMNPETGVVYIGTKTGLYSVQTSILRPNNAFNTIKTYPAPFNINEDSEITISGLVSGSEVRITTPDGKKIRTITTNSKHAIWDGRDDSGARVPPGIYIIIASSSIVGESTAGKVAVVE